MKKLFMALTILLILATVAVVSAVPAPIPVTYHWLLEKGDDAYILCAYGRFVIEVNGPDSIHILCRSD